MAAIFLKNYHKKQKENLDKLKVFIINSKNRFSHQLYQNLHQMTVNTLIYYYRTLVHNCMHQINKIYSKE